jgi:hypothetical protein
MSHRDYTPDIHPVVQEYIPLDELYTRSLQFMKGNVPQCSGGRSLEDVRVKLKVKVKHLIIRCTSLLPGNKRLLICAYLPF